MNDKGSRPLTIREALEEVHKMLTLTYGPKWNKIQMQALQRQVAWADPRRLLAAVDRHIGNTESDDQGAPRGTWAPKPAEILVHLNAIETEEKRTTQSKEDETRRLQIAEWEAQAEDDKFKSTPLADLNEASQRFWKEHVGRHSATKEGGGQFHIAHDQLRIPQNRVAHYQCSFCLDSGWDTFYYDPADKRRVWLREEAARLPEQMRDTLGTYRAVCDRCVAGATKKADLKHAILVTKQVTLMSRIRKLAAGRRQREAGLVGAETATTQRPRLAVFNPEEG